jgi:hypothetical protein
MKTLPLLKIPVFCDTTPYESTGRHISEICYLHQYHWQNVKAFYSCFQTNVMRKEKSDGTSETVFVSGQSAKIRGLFNDSPST